MLEDFRFMPAKPQCRSATSPSPCPSLPTTTTSALIDQTITDDDDSEMADDLTMPNQLIPEFKVKGDGSSTDIVKCKKKCLRMQRMQCWLHLTHALWAVHKQKGHHTVSKGAMMHLDAILNQN
jgi:hypothetical protein